MATYSTDFSEYTVGVPPPDWTVDPISIVTVEDAGGGVQFLHLSAADGDRTGRALWDVIEDDPDPEELEMLALIDYPGGIPQFYEGIGLVAWEAATPAGYTSWFQRDGFGFDYSGQGLALTADGGTVIATDPFTVPAAGTKLWMRMRLSDAASTIQVWWWEDGDTPKVNTDTPDASGTNSTYQPVSRGGLYRDAPVESQTLDCYWFSVGTNGDAAPLPGVGGGNVIAWIRA